MKSGWRLSYWKRRHRMNILILIVERTGNRGITPKQIYAQMNVGVNYGNIARNIAVLFKDGFLSRLLSLAVDTRVYNYRATRTGHEAYLEHSFDIEMI
jgi:predicted transcriptional regulator